MTAAPPPCVCGKSFSFAGGMVRFDDGTCHGEWRPCPCRLRPATPEEALKAAGVPEKEREYTRESLTAFLSQRRTAPKPYTLILDQVIKYLRDGESVLLMGPNGVFKTSCAVLAMRARLADGVSVKYVYVPQYISELRTLMQQRERAGKGERIDTEEELLESYLEPDLLVLDDLGAEQITPWARTMLALLVHQRNLRAGASTIGTTNLPMRARKGPTGQTVEGIREHYGSAFESRLLAWQIVLDKLAKLPDLRRAHR